METFVVSKKPREQRSRSVIWIHIVKYGIFQYLVNNLLFWGRLPECRCPSARGRKRREEQNAAFQLVVFPLHTRFGLMHQAKPLGFDRPFILAIHWKQNKYMQLQLPKWLECSLKAFTHWGRGQYRTQKCEGRYGAGPDVWKLDNGLTPACGASVCCCTVALVCRATQQGSGSAGPPALPLDRTPMAPLEARWDRLRSPFTSVDPGTAFHAKLHWSSKGERRSFAEQVSKK